MTYTPTDWVDQVTPVDAAHMDKIEQGIVDAHTLAGHYNDLLPFFWAPPQGPYAMHAPNSLTANRACLVRFVCTKPITISRLTFVVTAAATANDPCDVGIYSAAASPARLASSGSVLGKLNVLGLQTVPLTAPLALAAGTAYYAAFACGAIGGTAAQIDSTNMNPGWGAVGGGVSPNILQTFMNSAFPLPTSITTSGGITLCPILALVQ